jgi:hypothetical protein
LRKPEYISCPPVISFIIGHRGVERLPHLLATLESIAGQQGVSIECIIVEQDTSAIIFESLPHWVRYIHTPPPVHDMPYCRSWAFNVGVNLARGSVLVLHDNDMLVSADYALQILSRIKQGHEVVNLKRFIFYLNESHTKSIFDGKGTILDEEPEKIVQNLEAGGSVAITSEAYHRIGGMDESFVGWGGEDNEFWERAQTCRVWPYSCLPLIHLWHPAQPFKDQIDAPTLKYYRELSGTPIFDRIGRLHRLALGDISGPAGYGKID